MGNKEDGRLHDLWGKSASGRGNSLSKGLWVGVYSKNTREARGPYTEADYELEGRQVWK